MRYTSLTVLEAVKDNLPALGDSLRHARKQRFPKDDLAAFALRIGVSRSTLQKMEKGDLSVSMGRYYRAAEILGLGGDLQRLAGLRGEPL